MDIVAHFWNPSTLLVQWEVERGAMAPEIDRPATLNYAAQQ